MKRKDLVELKSKTLEALEKLAFEKKANVLKTKMSINSGKEKNLTASKVLRRDVAQILTLVREKKIIESLESSPKVKEETEEKKGVRTNK